MASGTTPPQRRMRFHLRVWASFTAVGSVVVGLLIKSRSDGWKIIVDGHDYVVDLAAWAVLVVAISGLLLTAGRLAATGASPTGRTDKVVFTVLVVILWGAGAVAGVLALFITNFGNYYRLETSMSDRHWLVERGPALGDVSYDLYVSPDGIRYRFSRPMGHSRAEWDPFSPGDYQVMREDGRLLLRYPTGPDRENLAEIVLEEH
ncbi:hypothetical protein [Georgenia ruanii]|uniref:hypothetical protein n=1 Tax=Georgenia ruanii TaxID=348442 RepID=UPI001264C603|nr:hypothetical protein [Georgenia ruanii]